MARRFLYAGKTVDNKEATKIKGNKDLTSAGVFE